MPRRGPGSKCSPASSPALSYSTGLRLGPSWGSLVDLVLPSPAMCAAALIALALYFLVASIVCYLCSSLSAALVAKLLLVAASVGRGSRHTDLFLLAAGVALLYGGEFFEVIRFMDPEAAELRSWSPRRRSIRAAAGRGCRRTRAVAARDEGEFVRQLSLIHI